MKIPNIVQGNSFTLMANLKTTGLIEGVETEREYDLNNSTDIKAYLIKPNNLALCEDKYEITNISINTEDNHVLNLEIGNNIPVGSYGLEITGKNLDGTFWRFKAKPGEMFNIVDASSGVSTIGDGYFHFDTIIGVPSYGAQGPQGLQGEIGPQGSQGEQGVQGAQGYQGDVGPQGSQGPQGYQGVKGADGIMTFSDLTAEEKESLRGPQGSQGEQGVQGAQGYQGDIGPQGSQGLQGAQGNQGEKGADGVMTFSDLTAEQKESLRGPQGHQGDVGPQGSQGSQGVQGPQGTNGTDGVQGSQGAQGSQGPQGEKGADGTMTFEDLTPEQLASLTGAQGPQGSQGAKGVDGAQGSQGAQGANGINGVQGPQGDKGSDGPQGSQGVQGANGVDGTQGSQGTQGPQGANGTDGPQGSQGAQGVQGSNGTNGAQGSQGAQGVQGPQGSQGANGNTVNADWNETDENSSAYINNKPFGDSYELHTMYNNNSYSLSTQVGPTHHGGDIIFEHPTDYLATGKLYKVTIDNVVYELECKSFSGGYPSLNIDSNASSPYTDTWSIFSTNGTALFINDNWKTGSISIKIEQLTQVVNQIDNKYIDLSAYCNRTELSNYYTKSESNSKFTQKKVNWDELDEFNVTFINNKPFGVSKDINNVNVVNVGSISFATVSGNTVRATANTTAANVGDIIDIKVYLSSSQSILSVKKVFQVTQGNNYVGSADQGVAYDFSTGAITLYDGTTGSRYVYIDRYAPLIKKLDLEYLPIWTGTQAQYDALSSYDSSTIYIIQ